MVREQRGEGPTVRVNSYTPAQREALGIDRHMAVTANAGSGKTTVLVRRFIDILRTTDCEVGELVAITFTEKAASELRRKIASEIDVALTEDFPPAQRERLLRAKDHLASANISTIHAFCSALLREYPVEADIDAGFTVLEELDTELLIREAITATVDDVLGSPEDPLSKDLTDCLRMLGASSVQSHLQQFMKARTKLGIFCRDHPKLDSGTWVQMWTKAVDDSLLRRISRLPSKTLAELALANAKPKRAEQIRRVLGDWKENPDPECAIARFLELYVALFTKEGKPRADLNLGSVSDVRLREQLGEMGQLGVLVQNVRAESSTLGNRVLADTLVRLFAIYQRALARYDDHKNAQGKLDFEDLQKKVLGLLENAEVRSAIARRYRFVMVDEFQDTDVLQYGIVNELVAHEDGPLLYVVGDPKQSIYGFRSAEVRMFLKIRNDLDERNRVRNLGLSSQVVLPESFRLLTGIVAFVNSVFMPLLVNDDEAMEVTYDELVRGRPNDAEGRIEFLLAKEEGGGNDDATKTDSKEQLVRTECAMIARRIALLKSTGYTIWENAKETPHPFEFRHAAILLRSRKHLLQLQQTLEAYGVPAIVSGGIGYYQTQEILDFHNYLKFLLDPQDDVALVGILRSPFFVVSDVELFDCARVHPETPFWNRIQAFEESGNPSSALRRAIGILRRNLEVANRLPIAMLVERMLRATGWHGAVAGLAFGPQRLANINKLVRFAREFEGKGLANLYDIVERLNTLVSEEEKEGQAAIDLEGNAVRIMTVHGAKGLEFPVVFLPFLHSGFRTDRSPYIDSELGVAFNVRQPENLNDKLVPGIHYFLKDRNKRKLESEEKRILYVACTRGRDLLVLSGAPALGQDGATSLKWIESSLGIDLDHAQPGELPVRVVRTKFLEISGSEQVQMDHDFPLKVHVFTNLEQLSAPAVMHERAPSPSPITTVNLDELAGQFRGEMFSATQIRTFLECPTKYYLRYRLGLPDPLQPVADEDEIEDPYDTMRGELEGTITHAVLQQFATGAPDDRDSLRATILSLARSVQGPRIGGEDAICDEIESLVMGYYGSDICRKVSLASTVRVEHTITAAFGTDFLTGTIDCLCSMPDGSCWIIDYKTDRVPGGDVAHHASRYKTQMLFYALLVRKFQTRMPVRATLVFLRDIARSVDFEFSLQDLDAFESVVDDVIRRIRRDDFSRMNQVCADCPYESGGHCLVTFPGEARANTGG